MFRRISVLTALICAVLFALLLLSPASYVATYGVVADAGGMFMVRRASPMFLGFAVMLWLAREGRHRFATRFAGGLLPRFRGSLLQVCLNICAVWPAQRF